MARLVEMVRNSPLVGRRAGGYEVLDTEKKDPFTRGISFIAHFVASVEVATQHDCPAVQDKVTAAFDDAQKATKHGGKPLRKVSIVVKSNNIRVTDVSNKVCDDYPIFRIAYGGGHTDMADVFFFIHKTKIDKALRAEIFKFENAAKVKAVTLTVAKAFNIAYKAWLTKKRNLEREQNRGSESPVVQRKLMMSKLAPGIVKTAGPYTPPVPRKDDTVVTRPRRGSVGDSPENGSMKNPAITRVIAQNETTGSTHNVTLTSDFDKEFQELAESRVNRPDVLRTSLAIDETDSFTFDSIKAHIDGQ